MTGRHITCGSTISKVEITLTTANCQLIQLLSSAGNDVASNDGLKKGTSKNMLPQYVSPFLLESLMCF